MENNIFSLGDHKKKLESQKEKNKKIQINQQQCIMLGEVVKNLIHIKNEGIANDPDFKQITIHLNKYLNKCEIKTK